MTFGSAAVLMRQPGCCERSQAISGGVSSLLCPLPDLEEELAAMAFTVPSEIEVCQLWPAHAAAAAAPALAITAAAAAAAAQKAQLLKRFMT